MAKPIVLDGLAKIEGKGKGATHPIRAYLTENEFHEYITYQFSRYKWETINEEIARDERHWALHEKIDHEAVCRYYDDLRNQRSKAHAGYELGPREFTLTYSPDWFDDNKAMFFMEQAIHRLCNYYSAEIVELRAVGERTKKGNAHIHCYYELKGGLKITDKNMKRAYFKWNAKHHHHQVVRKTSDFKGYIEKEVSTAWFKKIILPSVINNQDALSAGSCQGEEVKEGYDEDESGDSSEAGGSQADC
jgi:Geminivirus Rep catalytic domain.